MKKLLLGAFLPIIVFASANDRALYIKKYKKENKVALIIGNKNYKYFSKLKNSKNDATDIKNVLSKQGFETIYLENANLRQMEKSVRKFTRRLKSGGVGLFYYAGHGIEVEGQNYLIPVNAEIPEKDEVKYETLAVNMLIDKMQNSKNRLNIVILDACRNDPFSRSSGGGLAVINNAKGMYIAYATAPGEVASDGAGRNGLFTKHLLSNLQTPNLTLNQVFDNTRTKVYTESKEKQLPWTSSSVIGQFYFNINSKKELEEPIVNFSSEKQDFFSLTINTTPSNAKVQILNIKPKYYDGIKLKKDEYIIKVSSEGYLSKKGTIKLTKSLNLDIKLEKEKIVQSKTLKTNKAKSFDEIKDKYGNIYKTLVSPYTGKIWLDRNLGAKRVCQSYNDEKCYGDYFQWGRSADGHEKKNSKNTAKAGFFSNDLADTSTPNHSKFILSDEDNRYDWLKPQNNNLWQGIDGKNNPCPKGFRVPTKSELSKETIKQGFINRKDAFDSFLRLPSTGYRGGVSGSISYQGSWGSLWSSTVDGKDSKYLHFNSSSASWISFYRAYGQSVRCIKE